MSGSGGLCREATSSVSSREGRLSGTGIESSGLSAASAAPVKGQFHQDVRTLARTGKEIV